VICTVTVVERDHSFLVGARASIVDANDRMQAWAEKHVRKDADLKWILGNFIQTDAANDNGHIFPLEDVRQTQQSIWHKPLNMLHHGNYIVGCFAGAELIEPSTEAAHDDGSTGTVEALAAFWRAFFPEEYALVEAAHNEGALYYSMECVPASLTCPQDGCGVTAAYMGRTHESYCDHMNALRGPKRLNMPHFNAGALIIPPVRPGWKGADIKELSELMNRNADLCEQVYAGLERDMTHLSATEWESMMAHIVTEALGDPTLPIPELVAPRRPRARTVAAGQIPKDQANYRKAGTGADPDEAFGPDDDDDGKNPDNCFNCRNGVFVVDDEGNVTASMCELVSGPIAKEDVCDLYSATPTEVRIERWATYSRPSDAVEQAALAEYARKFTMEQRKKLAKEGKAKSDGSFPIENEEDLKNAIKLAKKGDRAHVKKRAAALGKTNLIPDSWK
jgi:hypothetical protein